MPKTQNLKLKKSGNYVLYSEDKALSYMGCPVNMGFDFSFQMKYLLDIPYFLGIHS